jgi:hypothetical protein
VVSVVNSYAPTSECVPVNFDMRVDLPTEGKPIWQKINELAHFKSIQLYFTDKTNTSNTSFSNIETNYVQYLDD